MEDKEDTTVVKLVGREAALREKEREREVRAVTGCKTWGEKGGGGNELKLNRHMCLTFISFKKSTRDRRRSRRRRWKKPR